jgi:hypothetical protein
MPYTKEDFLEMRTNYQGILHKVITFKYESKPFTEVLHKEEQVIG